MTKEELAREYHKYIRNWPGNPRSDLTHLLSQSPVFPKLIDDLVSPFLDKDVTHVATVDAGGFPLGGGIAYRLQAGLVMIRKGGRIDWASESIACVDFSGTHKLLEIAADALSTNDRVLVVDDWSETGGQVKAAIALVERLGATVIGVACLHIDTQVFQQPDLHKYQLHCVIK